MKFPPVTFLPFELVPRPLSSLVQPTSLPTKTAHRKDKTFKPFSLLPFPFLYVQEAVWFSFVLFSRISLAQNKSAAMAMIQIQTAVRLAQPAKKASHLINWLRKTQTIKNSCVTQGHCIEHNSSVRTHSVVIGPRHAHLFLCRAACP